MEMPYVQLRFHWHHYHPFAAGDVGINQRNRKG